MSNQTTGVALGIVAFLFFGPLLAFIGVFSYLFGQRNAHADTDSTAHGFLLICRCVFVMVSLAVGGIALLIAVLLSDTMRYLVALAVVGSALYLTKHVVTTKLTV